MTDPCRRGRCRDGEHAHQQRIFISRTSMLTRAEWWRTYMFMHTAEMAEKGCQRRIEENTEKHRARDEKFILVRAVWRNRTFEFLHFAPAERHRSKSILRLIWSVGIVFATGRLVVSLGFTCLWHPMRTYIHIFRHSHNNTPRCSTTGYLPLIMTSRCTSTRVVFLNIIAAGFHPT